LVSRSRIAFVPLFAIVCLFALALAGSVAADDGDQGGEPLSGHIDPAVSLHDTTFDDVAPAWTEGAPGTDAGYIAGSTSQCLAFSHLPLALPGLDFPQWILVDGDGATTVEGQVTSSKLAWDDNFIDHHSRDRNFFIYPDPLFTGVLTNPGSFEESEDNEHGRIEVEWESAAFPAWALPMMGDRVHVEGSHIWDCAHGDNGYRTEIHPPRLVMTLRDAADQDWSNGTATIPARPGWTDTMPGLGSVPVPVTRADVFGSSDGGEAREQETCFGFQSCPHGRDWYQPLSSKSYDLFVPAPPQPDPDAQLVVKLIKRPFLNCDSDDDNCGQAVDVLQSEPGRFTFSQAPGPIDAGVGIHVDFSQFTEPSSFLYGFGFTLEVGWNRAATIVPRRLKVTVLGVHVKYPQDFINFGDPSLSYEDGEYEISGLIGDTFRHLLLTGGPKVPSYDHHQDVPDTEDVTVGDYGIKTSGSCGLVADSGADTSPCKNSFEVTLLQGEPLRVFFRAEEHDGDNENDESGSVERILTEAQNYGIGTHVEWFQDRTSAGDDALDVECMPVIGPCLRITYKIEDDPIAVPPQTVVSAGPPVVSQNGDTWVTSSSGIKLTATAANGQPDALVIHERFWRSTTAMPGDSVCATGTGTASCTVHLNANDGSDGQYMLEYFAEDTTTGAVAAPQTVLFMRDDTNPTTNISLAGTLVRGWYNTPVTVTLSATDGAGVGVDRTRYTVDGGGPLHTYGAPFVVTGDSATHLVVYWSEDKLANTESAKSKSFQIDTTPPTLAISTASDGAFSYSQDELVNGLFTNASSLSFTYGASDALSGLYDVRIDGTSIASSGTTSVALPAGISTHSLVAEDVAGNLTALSFAVVSVSIPAGTLADPHGAGYWKNTGADLSTWLAEVNIVSRAFGAPDFRYDEATPANYLSFLTVTPNVVMDLKVRRELLVAWLNLVSGQEPAAQKIDLKSVAGWADVVKNNGSSSVTTALNLVRESERRLEESPSDALLGTIQTLLEKLNSDKLNK